MDLSDIGAQFGLTPAQTQAALDALAPIVAGGMNRSAQSGSGGLGDILAQLGGRYADDPNAIQFDNVQKDGNSVLQEIFGSKDVSRGVAQQLSATSGIGAAIIKKLLPVVAAIVMGQVAKRVQGGAGGSGGGLGDILGDILGGGRQPAPQPRAPQPQPQSGNIQDILKDIFGGGQGGGTAQSDPSPAPRRQRTGDAAGDLLNSVEDALRRRS